MQCGAVRTDAVRLAVHRGPKQSSVAQNSLVNQNKQPGGFSVRFGLVRGVICPT
jgi:hypothetical protein